MSVAQILNHLHSTLTHPRQIAVIWVGIVVSLSCSIFFSLDVIGDLLDRDDFPGGRAHELIELLVVAISVMALFFLLTQLRRLLKRHRRISNQMRVAAGEFSEVADALFEQWQLSPAERDVALFLMKGLSFKEIATYRNSKEGTVKAQANAVYRKADVNGRHQLLAVFFDELIADPPSMNRTSEPNNGQA